MAHWTLVERSILSPICYTMGGAAVDVDAFAQKCLDPSKSLADGVWQSRLVLRRDPLAKVLLNKLQNAGQ
jgi:hypothetical protein